MVLVLLLVFIIGALSVVALEAVGLWILIDRLSRKVRREELKARDAKPVHVNPSLHDKQGTVWVLEPDKVPNIGLEDKVPKEQRRRKEVLEIIPVRKYAKIKDHSLILRESDGSCIKIPLRGCTIVAVSATSLSSRKWAKRYPIKVENKDSAMYNGYKIIYIYLETSLEKESWCKALRLASYDDEEKVAWFSKLQVDFHYYLASLSAGYPSFVKPFASSNVDTIDKSIKLDNSSSKVRQFLKKLTKKASKSGQDYKAGGISTTAHEMKLIDKSRSFQDSFEVNALAKMDPTGKPPNISFDDASIASSLSTSGEQGSRNPLPAISEQGNLDEGTLCLNLLISRLFFDAKNNTQIRSSIQNRIQRGLSNMRIPIYIGEILCTALDLGTLPPRILAMRVLPSDMNEEWSFEIDVEYLGGFLLEIETRIEIQELEFEGEESHFEMNSGHEVSSDLLEDFEYLGKQLKLSEETRNEIKQKDEDHVTDETGNSKSTANASPQGSKWKSILHSITKQVSQVGNCASSFNEFPEPPKVPLSLGIRVTSLSGTIRLCMKPPPSDQLWFGFTSMPDIQFNLESSVGDHKITSGHLVLFLISRFKAGIREMLVLPNSESVTIPWMLAEKDDWVPRKAAPFMWYKSSQDPSSNTTKQEVPSFPAAESTRNVEANHGNPPKSEVNNNEKSKDVGHIPQVTNQSLETRASSSNSMDDSTVNDSSLEELRASPPKKLRTEESLLRSTEDKLDISLNSRSLASRGIPSQNSEESRRIGTRERMLGLGKKMGEKLEVKKRHFEEKSRSFVERMRAP